MSSSNARPDYAGNLFSTCAQTNPHLVYEDAMATGTPILCLRMQWVRCVF